MKFSGAHVIEIKKNDDKLLVTQDPYGYLKCIK
jgi:hypothetical protein